MRKNNSKNMILDNLEYTATDANSATKLGTFSKLILLTAIVVAVTAACMAVDYQIDFWAWILILVAQVALLVSIAKSPGAATLQCMLYAAVLGLFVGNMNVVVTMLADIDPAYAIVIPAALGGTLSVVVVIGLLYSVGFIKFGEKLGRIFMGLIAAYFMATFFIFIMSIFDSSIMFGTLGLLVAGLGVLLGAFFVLMDIQRIDEAVQQGAPKTLETKLALSLLSSIVMLYLELVRFLLIILMNND